MKRFQLNQKSTFLAMYYLNYASCYEFNKDNEIISFCRIKIKNPIQAKELIDQQNYLNIK